MGKIVLENKPFNKDLIKLFAMISMTLNHIATIFMEPSFLKELMLDIGYFTLPVMIYFLIEGYRYTRSKKKYALRLFIFALISQFPFSWQVGAYYIRFDYWSIYFTLLICFFIIYALDRIENKLLQAFVVFLLTLLTIFSDWQIVAPLFTITLFKAKEDKEKTIKGFLLPTAVLVILLFINNITRDSIVLSLLYSCMAAIGPLLAMFTIVYLYNGKRINKGQNLAKWFFYLYYPLHLLLLKLIKLMLIA